MTVVKMVATRSIVVGSLILGRLVSADICYPVSAGTRLIVLGNGPGSDAGAYVEREWLWQVGLGGRGGRGQDRTERETGRQDRQRDC